MKKKTEMKKDLKNILRRIRADNKGAALVEMALVAPIIITASIGTLEMGAVMLSTTLIEGALTDASRAGMTGYIEVGMTREEYINDLLRQRTFGMIEANNLTITQKVYKAFGDVGLPEPYTDVDADGYYTPGVDSFTDLNCNNSWDEEVGTAGLGGPGDVVVYNVTYDSHYMTGYFSKMMGSADGKIKLTASTAIKNEPFGAPSPGCEPLVKT